MGGTICLYSVVDHFVAYICTLLIIFLKKEGPALPLDISHIVV